MPSDHNPGARRALHHQGIGYLQDNAGKLAKYLAVTVGSFLSGTALFALFFNVVGLPALWANTLSFCLVVIPNYIGNRYWVWALRSKNSIKGEIAPFWILNVFGYVVSTLAVVAAEAAGWPGWAVVGANIAAFGFVWVLKLFVFEKFMFGKRARAESEAARDLAPAEV